jgi:DNA-nicking Smr family endonuclease
MCIIPFFIPTMKQNKYIQTPDKVIDLHGLTTDESADLLGALLMGRRGVHVRIIVGKGTRSANGPVLPDFVKHYLARHDVSFRQSKIQEGGEGALEVFF